MGSSASTLALALAAAGNAFAQQPAPTHDWAPVVSLEGNRVDLDTATMQRLDGMRRVWLRWHLGGIPNFAVSYELEQREIDCPRHRTRLLSLADVDIDETGHQDASTTVVSASEAAWHSPSPGSVSALVVDGVCRWRA